MNERRPFAPATVGENVGFSFAGGLALGMVFGHALGAPILGALIGGALGATIGWLFRFAGNPEAARRARETR